MKRAIPVILILAVALVFAAAPGADAGFLDKWQKKETESKKPHRYDTFPTMSFHKGVLSHGLGTSWELDGVALVVRSDCSITSDYGGDPQLLEGKEALVMGPMLGEAIMAYRVRILKPDYMYEGVEKSGEFTPSEVDPTVGEGHGPQ